MSEQQSSENWLSKTPTVKEKQESYDNAMMASIIEDVRKSKQGKNK